MSEFRLLQFHLNSVTGIQFLGRVVYTRSGVEVRKEPVLPAIILGPKIKVYTGPFSFAVFARPRAS
jgi:hypothetical protein